MWCEGPTTMSLWLWFFQKPLFLVVLFLAHVHAHSQDPESWSSKLGACPQSPGKHAREAKTIYFLFFYFYFQLDKLLTFKSRVLIFLAWLVNSGNTRLPVPGEPHCTVCLKCGLELQNPNRVFHFQHRPGNLWCSPIFFCSIPIPVPTPPPTTTTKDQANDTCKCPGSGYQHCKCFRGNVTTLGA